MSLAKGLKVSLVALAVAGYFWLSLHLGAASVPSGSDQRVSENYAHYMMGIIYDHQNKLDEAIQEYRQALAIDNQSAQLHLHLGSAYIRKSEFDKAMTELRQAKTLEPDNFESGLLLALVYNSQGKSSEAILEYEEALKKAHLKDPQNIDILKSLAALYYQRSDFDTAIKTYSLILEDNKDDYEVIFLLGSLYAETGKRFEAIKKFKQALVFKPDYAEAQNSLGYLYAEEGKNLIEAENLIKGALLKDQDNAAYIDSLGWVYFKKNLIDDAVRELEKASSLFPDPTIFDHLGDAYLKKGNKERAIWAWEKSLELSPKQEQIKEKVKRLKDKK